MRVRFFRRAGASWSVVRVASLACSVRMVMIVFAHTALGLLNHRNHSRALLAERLPYFLSLLSRGLSAEPGGSDSKSNGVIFESSIKVELCFSVCLRASSCLRKL